MTKKDYEKIAAILKKYQDFVSNTIEEDELLAVLAKDFADMLAEDNPRFDRERFLKAAGVEIR